jgi:deoxyribodipyrimidine photo-lyase
MKKERIRKLNTAQPEKGAVLYWMDRDRRAHDNWALIAAINSANQYQSPLHVLYVIPDQFLNANKRTYTFMLDGLQETAKNLITKNIHFHLVLGEPTKEVPDFIDKNNIKTIFTDFTPLRLPRSWRDEISQKISIPFYEVDTRNIIPCWVLSDKEEYAARTIRPKIHKKLDEYLDTFPNLMTHKYNKSISKKIFKTQEILSKLPVNNVSTVDAFTPGEQAAKRKLRDFLDHKVKDYGDLRNDPNQDVLSELSPYLHYGQISSQYITLKTNEHKAINPHLENSIDSFLEELIVRRELTDNYCYYNPNYDNFQGFKDWAKASLYIHQDDPREYLYTYEEFEGANTHDELWNAAQNQMLQEGKMHGYMRMYWCKKILEWTKTPEEAQQIAIKLNDTYQLDGRDPNGYVGIAWSIGGVHDRAWFEREIYGKIRYMNFNGAKRKFNVQSYIDKYSNS